MTPRWPLVPLRDLLTPVSRPEPVDPTRTYRLLGAHWYARGLYVKDVLPGSQIRAARVYRVEEGDFVYNRLFAWKGSFAIATAESDGCYVSNEFPCLQLDLGRVDPAYLWRYFGQARLWQEALGLSTGGTPTSRNRLKEERLLAMRLPLPPSDEQRRIATRIDELACGVEQARGLRQQAAQQTEALERTARDEVYTRLAGGFGVVPLGAVSLSITDGDHLTPRFQDAGVRFIFVGNVSSGSLHFSNCKHVAPEYYEALSPNRKPKRGDVLYSAVGATLGIPAVVDTDTDFCFQRHVAIIKLDLCRVEPRYAWHMLRSGILYQEAWAQTTGSAQPTVPLRAIRQLPIPVPPMKHQRRATGYLDDLQAKADAAKQLQLESATELEALLPAMLARAFEVGR